jgi:ATP-binding cassette subfamily B protein
MPYFRENRSLIAIGLVCLILADSGQLYIPRIIKRAVDDLTALRADGAALLSYALTIIVTALFIAVFRYGWRRCLIGTSRLIEEKLRDRFFTHIQSLSAPYFGRVSVGDLMAHASNDITSVRMATGMGLVAMMDAVFLGTSTILFMIWIDGRLTFFALLPMPLIVITARMFSRLMHARYRNVQASFSRLTEGVRERFAGIRVVKAYTREEESRAQVERLSREFVARNIDLIRVTGSFFPLMITISNISLILVIYFGGRGTILGEISPGDLVAFISYLGLLTWPMMALGWMTNLIQRGKASLERIGEVFAETPDIADSGNDAMTFTGEEPLRFSGVSFAYKDKGPDALTDISFTLNQGGIIGLVGPPGCGKTTLLSLVPRVFDPSGGSIRLGDTNIRDIGLSRLRDMISFAPQEPFLFEGSIRDNILMGNSRATDIQLIDATKKACLYGDVARFKNGFDTLVGERGVILSGGQKQRVALARAFLHDRDIMVFDDPVSQVDTRTGAAIIETLKSLSRTKKILVSSHRLAALRSADEILVLDRGNIVERGNHDRLMALGGYYARTSRLQDMEEDVHAV